MVTRWRNRAGTEQVAPARVVRPGAAEAVDAAVRGGPDPHGVFADPYPDRVPDPCRARSG